MADRINFGQFGHRSDTEELAGRTLKLSRERPRPKADKTAADINADRNRGRKHPASNNGVFSLVGDIGFEPITSATSMLRSSQMS